MSYDVAQTFRKDQATGKVTLAGDGRKALTDADIGPHAGQVAVNNAHHPATLDLDFANGRYRLEDGSPAEITDPTSILSVTRASPKWVFGPNGVLREVPIDTLARDFDPVTHEPRGVLIEESRTNLLLWSGDFSNAVWDKSRSTVTANATVAPDGSATADKLIEDTATGGHYIDQAVTGPDGSMVVSFFVKAAERVEGKIETLDSSGPVGPGAVFNLSTMTIESGDAEIKPLSGGWAKVSMPVVLLSGSQRARLILRSGGTASYTGDGTSGIYIWGAQLEEGSTPSSYIPTTSAAVTRDADTVSRSLGADFNPSGITIYSEANLPISRSGNVSVFALNNDDASAGPRIDFRVAPDGQVLNGGATTGLYMNEGVSNRFAFSITSNSGVTYSLNGASSIEYATAIDKAQLGFIHIGRIFSGAYYINGGSKSLHHYPFAMTAQELETLTAPQGA